MLIGLIREGKVPADSRVALTPAQCKWMHLNRKDVRVIVQQSSHRCYSDKEYQQAGVEVTEDLSMCDILLGIKEVPVDQLIPNKTYLFFSHTKKMQPYNQKLAKAMVEKNITLVDYECLEHEDGARIIGFGFFAGIVGAHNGMFAYGQRTGAYQLDRINSSKNFQHLVHTYFGLRLPNIKIAVTGSGRVAHGVLEIMNLLGVHEVEPDQYLKKEFTYPVYVHLKGADLYARKSDKVYDREDFHENPETYDCLFKNFLQHTDILMNGVYWEARIPRLFENEDMKRPDFRIKTIADITDDMYGSVPCNIGDSTIADPVYGVDRNSLEKTAPYIENSVDVMAVGNLPNELPRDASRYFGEQLIKYVLLDLFAENSTLIDKATIIKKGKLNGPYKYMSEYVN
ncbi:NAD(P)-dependent oxidoreductase [Ferruginibacter sp. HRS2-29]|uniref:NAD(P)-dependent oxidoreductase n=1 Tax=Ferruginibacter sp. HRS2-29 TaxID=2487334 RepID=UPI0020CC197B|nr:NAD(P)-dependent oxidoreductase [Ferruginibacter sp. HRS2-29]MCP9751591.1 alanine dehydrogenase [Ferruginibacter sp. HRS2-29]